MGGWVGCGFDFDGGRVCKGVRGEGLLTIKNGKKVSKRNALSGDSRPEYNALVTTIRLMMMMSFICCSAPSTATHLTVQPL
jgi:hypothetical protein